MGGFTDLVLKVENIENLFLGDSLLVSVKRLFFSKFDPYQAYAPLHGSTNLESCDPLTRECVNRAVQIVTRCLDDARTKRNGNNFFGPSPRQVAGDDSSEPKRRKGIRFNETAQMTIEIDAGDRIHSANIDVSTLRRMEVEHLQMKTDIGASHKISWIYSRRIQPGLT